MALWLLPARRALLALLVGALSACARERLPQGSAWPVAHPALPSGLPSTPGGSTVGLTSPRAVSPAPAFGTNTACLAELARWRVPYSEAGPTMGVQTPVIVKGPIGGVQYYADGGAPLVCDCRLALALAWVAPEFLRRGVDRVRFSGAYVYRRTRKGRVSLHAHGLAIDVHEVFAGNRALSVKRDYERGLGTGCEPDAPLLNSLACSLKGTRLFRELLTPDYDWDHRDHLHLAIAPG